MVASTTIVRMLARCIVARLVANLVVTSAFDSHRQTPELGVLNGVGREIPEGVLVPEFVGDLFIGAVQATNRGEQEPAASLGRQFAEEPCSLEVVDALEIATLGLQPDAVDDCLR